jgi:tRNA dimethylallyltransferase
VILSGGTGFYIRALMEGYDAMAPAPDPALRQQLMEREATEGLAALAEELVAKAPEVATRIDLKNPARVRRALERLASPPAPPTPPLPAFTKVKFRLMMPTEILNLRIEKRVDAMFSDGWAEEVLTLIAQGVPKTAPAFRAIGYLSLIEWLEGQASREDTRAEVILRTRQYAKRQRTWLRSEPGAIDIPVDGSEAGYAEALHLMMGHLTSVRG